MIIFVENIKKQEKIWTKRKEKKICKSDNIKIAIKKEEEE